MFIGTIVTNKLGTDFSHKEQVQNWKLPTFIARDTKFRTGHQLVLNWWLIGHLLVRRSVPYLQYSAIKEVMLPCRIGM